MSWKPEYGPMVKQLRARLGLTLKNVADAIAKPTDATRPTLSGKPNTVSESAVARWERDPEDPQGRSPEEWCLESLARALRFETWAALCAELQTMLHAAGPRGEMRHTFVWLHADEVIEELAAALPIVERPTSDEAERKDVNAWPGPDAEGRTMSPRTLWVSAGSASVIAAFLPRLFAELGPGESGPLDRVVILHLSRDLCASLERAGLLEPGFHEVLTSNVAVVRSALEPRGIVVQARPTDRVPAWHGFLLGDWLYRGSWQIGQSGLLDVHTALERIALQDGAPPNPPSRRRGDDEPRVAPAPLHRGARAHAEFIASFFPAFRLPAELGLAPGEYAVFGSGPMSTRGLRDPKDVDIIVTHEAWDRLVGAGHVPIEHGADFKLQIGDVEVLRVWEPAIHPVLELIREAELLLGIPFVRLDRVRQWKAKYNRPKDGPDVARIDGYAARSRGDLAISALQQARGRELRRLRGEQGLSLRELDRRTGLEASTLRHIEAGGEPRTGTLGLMADVLGFRDAQALLEEVDRRIGRGNGPQLSLHDKMSHLLRALSDPANRGRPLIVLSGRGDMTRALLSRAYEGQADGRRPVISGVVFHRLSDAMLESLATEGEIAPELAAALRSNVESIREMLRRAGVLFEERQYEQFPRFHGFLLGDYALVGPWKIDAKGHWHADAPVSLVRRRPDSDWNGSAVSG